MPCDTRTLLTSCGLSIVFASSAVAQLATEPQSAPVVRQDTLMQASYVSPADQLPCTTACESQFEQGRPSKLIDGVGWVFGAPRKLLLWDRRVENHDVSPATQVEVAEFLAVNELEETKVRINQYDPGGEWRRLVENKRVGAGWRYTLGTLHTLGYTLLPGRLIGNDSYNPYTDTINIYSDVPALALEQAAYAKDVHGRGRPGTYAAVQSLPVVGLIHERKNKQEVHHFLAEQGTPERRAEAHRILDPQMGSEVGGDLGAFVPGSTFLMEATGAAAGHIVGRRRASTVGEE
ncbi:hypothetical protein [Adhaeretor mobilis]|uniref:Uncharacterized protein n=1 Tax=Adhaeretor mobilis TaxID=1930276 RepID=A0A517MSZ8_9BACT|nr:hypothetical protein [Adhaeretor mobilis]QDS98010.1 hypothetical protein HG15A2_12800 [Adhaeretor mobilis]